MTAQEIFDTVWNGLKTQGFQKSVRASGMCAYRGCDGRRCAAGWLVDDADYKTEWEGLAVDDIAFFRQFGNMLTFVRELQQIHDGSHFGMENELRSFAEYRRLTVPA